MHACKPKYVRMCVPVYTTEVRIPFEILIIQNRLTGFMIGSFLEVLSLYFAHLCNIEILGRVHSQWRYQKKTSGTNLNSPRKYVLMQMRVYVCVHTCMNKVCEQNLLNIVRELCF
jgi:hypothetical protein